MTEHSRASRAATRRASPETVVSTKGPYCAPRAPARRSGGPQSGGAAGPRSVCAAWNSARPGSSSRQSGNTAPRVAEVGDDLQFPAKRADIVGQSGKLGDSAALDGRDALLGHAHSLRDLGLSQARFLAHLGQVLGPDLERSPLARVLHGRAVVGGDELVQELLARVGKQLRLLTHRYSFTYASYAASAAGTASRYQSCQRPDLSPAISSTSLRAGSKMNKIRTSLAPLEPGRSSFRLCSRDPALGQPAADRAPARRRVAVRLPRRRAA